MSYCYNGIYNDYNIEIPLFPMPVKDRFREYGYKRTDKVDFCSSLKHWMK